MSDATNTDSQHPALVTAPGTPAAPAPQSSATGTDDTHPAIVTRPGPASSAG